MAIALTASTSGCKEKNDIEQDEAAIIAIIEEERDATFDCDVERVNAVWYQGPASRKIDICKYCGVIEYVGWDEISKKNARSTEPERREIRKDLSVQFTDFDIQLNGHTALVYHDGTWTGKLNGEPFHFKEKRIVHLRRIDGDWKIDMHAHYSLPGEGT